MKEEEKEGGEEYKQKRKIEKWKEEREMREQYKNTSLFFIIELVCIFLELKKIYIYSKLVKKGEENVTNIESPEIKSKP